MVVRPDGLSYGVKQTRDLVLRAAGAPTGGRWRVVLFEDADRCTEQAANALLKAIEEPAPRTVWLLCAPSAEDLVTTPLPLPGGCAADPLVRRGGRGADGPGRYGADRAMAAPGRPGPHWPGPAAGHRSRGPCRREQVLAVPVRATSLGPALAAAAALVKTAEDEANSVPRARRTGAGRCARRSARVPPARGGQGAPRRGWGAAGPGRPAEIPGHPAQA